MGRLEQRKPAKTTRVVLVDDHPMVRERLAELLEREPDLAVCGQAEEHTQALEVIAARRPHLVILDLTLKSSHGLDLIKDAHARWPELPMLVVSMHDEKLHAERAVRAGARGYIMKQEATGKILLGVRAVLRGEFFLSEGTRAQLVAKSVALPDAGTGLPVGRLSDRELRVFELVGHGHSTRQIALQLKLDVRTVETYRARIKEKLLLRDGSELLQRAIVWVRAGARV